MSKDEFRRIVRYEKKRTRLGRKPFCAICGETDIRSLQMSGGEIHCADCRLVAQGKRPFEKHHPSGVGNDAYTVEVSGNDHAILTDMQVDWPTETLTNPKKSHVLKTAAHRRAAADFYRRLAEVEEEDANDYEIFDELCTTEIGDDWIEKLEKLRKRRQ